MEGVVIQVVESCGTRKEAVGRVGLGVDQVDGVMRRQARRGLERWQAEPIKYVGMNKSIGRGHGYATLLNDLKGCRVWEVVAVDT